MENPKNLQVGAIFNESKRFVVPIYQRTYEWTIEKQIGGLFDHIEAKARARLHGEPQSFAHYMGALLLIPRGNFVFGTIPVLDVVDGQQRLTTFQIVLAALHDLARANGFDGVSSQLRPLLYNLDESNMQDRKTEKYKLEPTRYDRSLLRDLFDLGADKLREKYGDHFFKNGKLKTSSAPKPLNAFWYLREEAEEFIFEKDSEKPELRLRALLGALLEDLRLIVITLDKDDDAQVIFETLNSGGQPLAAMDLVRNDVFHRARKQREDADDLMDSRWSRFEKPFWKQETSQGRLKKPRIDFFLAHTLAAETAKETALTELYVAYKQFVAQRKFATVDAELDVLLRHAPTYERLVQPSGDDALAKLARALDVFDVSTAYPLVFVIAASAADDETKAALYRLIESYVVRRALCGLTAKGYNNTFIRLAGQLNGAGVTLASLSAALAAPTASSVKFPSDAEVAAAIKSREQYGYIPQPRLRYILGKFENAARDGFDETEGLREGLQIEHILPNSWMEHWPLPDGTKAPPDLTTGLDEARRALVQQREAVKNTLGNLTLLTQPANIEVLNYAFSPSKRERLRSSLLRLNQDIAAKDAWNESEIGLRAQRLTELAVQVWPPASPIAG